MLASASPRCAELLRTAGIPFDVIVADVDESVRPGEASEGYVRRLAEAKARAVFDSAGGRPVLGADTVVVVDGQILGKPVDAGDAGRMLRILSGRPHDVLTAVCLLRGPQGSAPHAQGSAPHAQRSAPHAQGSAPHAQRSAPQAQGSSHEIAIARTTVEFAPLTDSEIEWYVASGEPADKAGAYAVQGLASRFVTRLIGSYSNVVGLPIAVVYRMCADAGLLVS